MSAFPIPFARRSGIPSNGHRYIFDTNPDWNFRDEQWRAAEKG
jgi:hypothetical protein